MTKNEQKEKQYKLLCEKIVNESWSIVEKYADEIEKVLNKRILNDTDILLLKVAAHAFIQKSIMEKSESLSLFGVDLYKASPCGKNPSCEDCPLEKCEYFPS